jgi:short-subunit dehydrogenase
MVQRNKIMNIVVTGGSKGIGKALALKFASGSHRVFICARNKKVLADAAKEINKKYKGAVQFFPVDISKKTSAIKFALWLREKDITPDILINNAGQFLPGSIYNEPDGTLEQMIAGNLYTAYYITRALLPDMIKQRFGHIFNMCSIASLKAYDNGGSYSISKHALMGFSKNLREEMKPYNIKVTAIYPGAALTASWEGSGVKASRIMQADDIVEMIYAASFLSPQACVEEILIRPQLGDL